MSVDGVDQIVADIFEGAGRSQSYDRLAEFVDLFGKRFTGTQALEDSIGISMCLLPGASPQKF